MCGKMHGKIVGLEQIKWGGSRYGPCDCDSGDKNRKRQNNKNTNRQKGQKRQQKKRQKGQKRQTRQKKKYEAAKFWNRVPYYIRTLEKNQSLDLC